MLTFGAKNRVDVKVAIALNDLVVICMWMDDDSIMGELGLDWIEQYEPEVFPTVHHAELSTNYV